MSQKISENNAYKQAGVDIEAGAELVGRIKPHVKKTNRSGVMSGLGGFGALFDLKEAGYIDPVLVSATDGVGTKLKIAIDLNRHGTVGQDLVAMCVNDLVVQGAEPLFFLDYFATGQLDPAHAEEVIAGIAQGCEIAGCALIGGETAEMPGLYAEGDYDLAGFTVGAVERDGLITGETISEGNIILGLASSGVHSNGFSLVRKLVETTQGYDYTTPLSHVSEAHEKTLGEALLEPTRIYVKPVLKALKLRDQDNHPMIKGMVHVTGGGLWENVPRILPEGCQAVFNAEAWTLPPIFKWLVQVGQLTHNDMMTTFNCGLGFLCVVPAEFKEEIKEVLESEGETVFDVGVIKKLPHDADEKVIVHNTKSAWGLNV